MKKTPQKTSLRTDKKYWEKRLVDIIEIHFKEAETRLPFFRSEELRNAKRVFWRNLKYTGIDFILIILNVLNMLRKLVFKEAKITKLETFTERYMRKRFNELVFHSDELEGKLRTFFNELDNTIHSLIQEEIAQLKAKKIPPQKYKKIIADAIDKSRLYSDITKLLVVETAVPIFASYYFANKITKGFGPVGVIVAESFYWNQLSWYQRLWYKLPEWLSGSPYPFWLPIGGSAVGFLIGLFIAAPILNASIDLFLNIIINPEKRLRKHLKKSKNELLYADSRNKKPGMVKIVFEKLNMAGEAADYLKDLYLVVR